MRGKDVREKNAMRAVRSLVVAVLAFVVFAVPSVILADGRVALVVGNSTYAHIAARRRRSRDGAPVLARPRLGVSRSRLQPRLQHAPSRARKPARRRRQWRRRSCRDDRKAPERGCTRPRRQRGRPRPRRAPCVGRERIPALRERDPRAASPIPPRAVTDAAPSYAGGRSRSPPSAGARRARWPRPRHVARESGPTARPGLSVSSRSP